MDTEREAELQLKVMGLTADVVALDRRIIDLTTQVGECLAEVRRLRRGERTKEVRG